MADGFAELEQDHRSIEEHFDTFMRDEGSPVVHDLAEQLTRHSQLEEAALYPALRRWVDGGDDLADRAQQEHSQIATMVAELYQSVTPERLGELVASLPRRPARVPPPGARACRRVAADVPLPEGRRGSRRVRRRHRRWRAPDRQGTARSGPKGRRAGRRARARCTRAARGST